MTEKRIIPCPNCGEKADFSASNSFRPFCSASCKNSDFIAWANEEQKIAEPDDYSDFMSEDTMNQLQ